jgi:Mrp family chromosome partitioning ATPase
MAVVADLAGYGHSEEEIAEIIEMAEDMEPSEAIGLVSKLGDEEKEYVTAFLAVVMAADGDIDDEEVAFWNLMTILCDLPEMTVREAVDLWKRYNS